MRITPPRMQTGLIDDVERGDQQRSKFALFLFSRMTHSSRNFVICRNKKRKRKKVRDGAGSTRPASMNDPVDVGERDGHRLVAHGAGDVALVGWLGSLF